MSVTNSIFRNNIGDVADFSAERVKFSVLLYNNTFTASSGSAVLGVNCPSFVLNANTFLNYESPASSLIRFQ